MIKRLKPLCVGVLAGALLLASGAPAHADQWNDRTILTFSAPVMVPGATLPPGEYEFQLADARTDRHLVRIYDNKDHRLITTTQAVPIKRSKVTDDVTLKLNPTEAGAPVAISAWFYPGSQYGHQFVYPEDQARSLADRTRTLVLSADAKDDAGAGTIHLVDAQGRQSAYNADSATMTEWEAWRKAHANATGTATAQTTPGDSSVPLVRSDSTAMKVAADDLEDNPSKYIDKRVSVDAEVEKVLGPRLFTIDEPSWIDLEGETLVLVPTPLAALVQDEDRVTVEGTIRPFTVASVEHEFGWLGMSPDELEITFKDRPVLVADRVVGGDNNASMVIDVNPTPRPTGTSGGARSEVSSLDQLAGGSHQLIGRYVDLGDVQVTSARTHGGFFVGTGDQRVFVLPAQGEPSAVSSGKPVSVEGVVMQMPKHMADQLNAPGANTDVYVYALKVE